MVDEKIEGEITIRYTDDDIVSETKSTAKAFDALASSVKKDMDDIDSSADKVKKGFEDVGKSAKSSGAKADKALDQTGEKAKKTAAKLKDTGAAGKKAGDDVAAGANKGARAMDNMSTSADGADNSMGDLSTSMIGLAQTATGVSDAIFGLSASLVGLEKTKFGIIGMEIAIERMKEDYITAFQEGVLTTREFERAAQDLSLAEGTLGLEFKQVAADEEALNGQMVTLVINTGAAIIQTIIAGKAMLALIAIRKANTLSTKTGSSTTIVNTGVTGISTGAKALNTKATLGQTLSNWGLVASLRAAAIAMRAFMLSNPITAAALIASTAAVIAYETNLGGMRDGIEDLTGLERGSLPTLSSALGEVENNLDDVNDGMSEARAAMAAAEKQTALWTTTINPLTNSITDASDEFIIFSSSLDKFNNQIAGAGIEALNSDMNTLISSVKTVSANMVFFPQKANLAMESISSSISNTAKQFDIAWGEGAFRKRLIQMRKFGEITREQFNLIGQSVDFSSQKIDNQINKIDSATDKFKSSLEATTSTLIQFEHQLAGLGVTDLENRVTSLTAAMQSVSLEGISTLSPAFKLAKKEILPEIKSIALSLNDAFGPKRTEEFIKEVQRFGFLTTAEYNKINDSVLNLNKSIDESKKNYDSLISKMISDRFLDKEINISQFSLASGRNIVGSSEFLINAAAGLSLTRNQFGQVTSNINFGTTSSFASSAGGPPGSTSRRGGSRGAKHGGSNRSDEFQANKAFQNITGGDAARQSLEALTGVSLGLQVDQVVRRGFSGRKTYRFDLLNAALAEANLRISLTNQIKILNPFSTAHPRMSSTQLQTILAEEAQKISFTQETLGLSQSEAIAIQNIRGGLTESKQLILQSAVSSTQIQDYLTKQSGLRDLANQILLSQRDELIRQLV